MKLSHFAISDAGRVRTNNEDSYGILERFSLYIVADGMGGHSSGEVASKTAVEGMKDFFLKNSLSEDATWPYEYDDNLPYKANVLRTAIRDANKKILDYVNDHPESKGMGTTIVSAIADDNSMIIGHIGDSRVYKIHDGKMDLLTSDHSWVYEQIRMGYMSVNEAAHHPFRNVITKALGTKGDVQPDMLVYSFEKSDLLLLCTDGLTTMVDEEEISKISTQKKSLKEVGEALVEAAKKGGGEDNITLILIRRDD